MMNLKTASAVNTVRARAEEFAYLGTTKLTIWKKAYVTLADADMRVLASPIHYYGLSFPSCLARFLLFFAVQLIIPNIV